MKIEKFAAFFASIALLACFNAVHASERESIKLTIPLPLTGTQGKFGEIERKSYEIAQEEINASGGIKGKEIYLEFKDSKDNPDISKAIVSSLIDSGKQPVILGEYSSSCSKALAALAEEKRVPYLVVSAAADEITQKNYQYVFRMCPVNDRYQVGLISFLKHLSRPKPATMAIIYESSEFGSSGAEDMAREAEKAGIKVVLKEPYPRETVDYVQFDLMFVPNAKPLLTKIRAAEPDVIYMVSYAEDAVLLMQELRRLDINARLYAGGAAGFAIPEFIQGARRAAEFVVTTTLWSPQMPYPKAREFGEKYKARFGKYPSYHGAEAYAALYVLKDVLERASTWFPADIQSAMKATNIMTAFGPIKFEDRDGYTNQSFMDTMVMQVLHGEHEIIWPKEIATARYVYPVRRWNDRR